MMYRGEGAKNTPPKYFQGCILHTKFKMHGSTLAFNSTDPLSQEIRRTHHTLLRGGVLCFESNAPLAANTALSENPTSKRIPHLGFTLYIIYINRYIITINPICQGYNQNAGPNLIKIIKM